MKMIPLRPSLFKRHSMTFRLSVSILSCVFAGGLAILFFLSRYIQPIVRDNVEALAQKSLQKTVSQITSVGWETEAAALTMKNTLKELKTSDVNMMRNILRSALQTLEYDESDASHAWIYVFPDGEVKSGTLYYAAISEGNFIFDTKKISDFYKSYPWFRATPKEENSFWSDPYIDEEHPQKPWVVTCLIPFKFLGSDDFTGLVAVSVDLGAIQREVLGYEFQAEGRFLVVSKDGTYIVHPDKNIQLHKTLYDLAEEYNLPQLKSAGFNLRYHKSGKTEMENSSVFNDSVILFYAPVDTMDWGVFLVFSQELFWEPVRSFQMKMMLAILLGLAVLFFIISYICHRSTKPLLDLSKIALQYGKGDFSGELPTRVSQDEIGTMTEAFHSMRDNLLEHIKLVEQGASEKQKSASELEIANQIQQAALPKNFTPNQAYEVNALMIPARQVGGDFYDAFFIDKEHFAVVIADVSGKGIPAALYMMTAKALIKSTAKSGIAPDQIFARVNKELCLTNANMFVTAFLAVLNIKTGVLEYVNAGHNPPFYKGKDGYKPLACSPNMVLGGLEQSVYKAEKLKMDNFERLFLYTDGVTEAQNTNGEFYGEERLQKILNQHFQSAADTLYFVNNDVAKFVDGAEHSDDITMLELMYCGLFDEGRVFTADVKNTSEVLDYIEQDMIARNIDEQKRRNMIVAAEEIFTNIAQYAYETSGRVGVKINEDAEFYNVGFGDIGREFNPLEKEEPDLTKSAEEREIGGLGIYLARKMTDKISYIHEGISNIITLSIKK